MPARTIAAIAATAAMATSTVLVAGAPAEAKPVSVKTSYACATVLGDQAMDVTIKLDLPTKVKKGTKVKDQPVNMTVVVPESLVGPMRDVLGITALSGSASDIKYTVGKTKVPLANVKIPRTEVPESGAMTLKAKGTAKGFTLKKPGQYVVTVPQAFTFNADDQNGNPVPSSPFGCALADGAASKLGTIKVTK